MADLKIAIVTGAGSGIGRAAALALMSDGFAVVLAGRRREPLKAVAAERPDARTLIVPTDVCDPASIKALFARTKETFGRLDLLFNNAGIGAPAVSLEELDAEKWRAVIETNVTGPFLCTQEAIKIMKAQTPRGGRIINNGSIAAHTPRPFSAAYTASKHAITGLTKATALDGRAYDIACGQIDIGNADTSLIQAIHASASQSASPREPVMDVADVGRAISYMASLPLEANVLFMTVMATKMPFVGRG